MIIIYFKTAGNALHRNGTSAGIRCAILGVNSHWKSVAKRHSSETHLNAYLHEVQDVKITTVVGT